MYDCKVVHIHISSSHFISSPFLLHLLNVIDSMSSPCPTTPQSTLLPCVLFSPLTDADMESLVVRSPPPLVRSTYRDTPVGLKRSLAVGCLNKYLEPSLKLQKVTHAPTKPTAAKRKILKNLEKSQKDLQLEAEPQQSNGTWLKPMQSKEIFTSSQPSTSLHSIRLLKESLQIMFNDPSVEQFLTTTGFMGLLAQEKAKELVSCIQKLIQSQEQSGGVGTNNSQLSSWMTLIPSALALADLSKTGETIIPSQRKSSVVRYLSDQPQSLSPLSISLKGSGQIQKLSLQLEDALHSSSSQYRPLTPFSPAPLTPQLPFTPTLHNTFNWTSQSIYESEFVPSQFEQMSDFYE